MSEETTTCRFCFSKVPWGATVCLGCHAVLKYGASDKWYVGAFALSVWISIWVGDFLNLWLSGLVGIICYAYFSYQIGERFKDKVIFSRYR